MEDEIKPVKPGERTHIQRQFIKWSKYWSRCKIQKNRERYFDQTTMLGKMVERELFSRIKNR